MKQVPCHLFCFSTLSSSFPSPFLLSVSHFSRNKELLLEFSAKEAFPSKKKKPLTFFRSISKSLSNLKKTSFLPSNTKARSTKEWTVGIVPNISTRKRRDIWRVCGISQFFPFFR